MHDRPTSTFERIAVPLAVAFVSAVVLYIPRAWVADLGPQPDASEYAMAAQNLAHHRGFAIDLLGRTYPPRYPIGFPLLLAPVYWLRGSSLASAIHVVIAFGVATAVLTFACARRVGGALAGALASGVLLARPAFIEWNHQVMSETVSTAAAVAVGLLLHRAVTSGETERRHRWLLVTGALCGVAIMVRLTNGLLALAAGGALLLDARTRADWRRVVRSLALGPLIAVVASAALNAFTFGSVTRTGYHYWVPYWHASLGKTFSLTYAIHSPGNAIPGRFGIVANAVYYADFILRSISSAGFLLALANGAWHLARRDERGGAVLVAYTGILTGALYVLYSLYFYQAGRFMAPILPLAAILTGIGLRNAGSLLRSRPRTARAVALGGAVWMLAAAGTLRALLFVAAQSYAWQRVAHGTVEPPESQPLSTTAAAYERAASPGSVVITAVPPTWLASLSSRGVRVVGLLRTGYWNSPQLEQAAVFSEQRSTIERMIDDGVAVFTDDYSLAVLRARGTVDARRVFATFRLTAVDPDSVLYRLTAYAQPSATAPASGSARR